MTRLDFMLAFVSDEPPQQRSPYDSRSDVGLISALDRKPNRGFWHLAEVGCTAALQPEADRQLRRLRNQSDPKRPLSHRADTRVGKPAGQFAIVSWSRTLNRSVVQLASCAFAFSLGLGSSTARESIVGVWATPGRCGMPLSTVTIEPRRFSGEDFTRNFSSVSRQGDAVRWQGLYVFGDDLPKLSSVTARLQGAGLSYRIGADGWNGPLQRCGRQSR
jgi:hypothetical protein